MEGIVICRHHHRAARKADERLALHRIVASLDIERAAIDAHETLCRVVVLVRLDAVAVSLNGEDAIANLHAIMAAQTILHSADVVRAGYND